MARKSALKKRLEFFLAANLGWLVIHLVCKTCRLRFFGLHKLYEFKKRGQPFLISLWHGRFFVGVYVFRKWRLVAMVSQHLDGEMIARNLLRMGFDVVRGSSTRSGKEAFHQLVNALKKGRSGAITPDGPKGPRHEIKNGVIFLAQQARVPIIPFTFSASSGLHLNSWDRFLIPRPFSKVAVFIGDPIWIPEELDDRALIRQKKFVEQTMIRQEQEADAFFRG